MNPCPCGYFGHPTRPCTCSAAAAQRYLARVSGPLLDRIDLHIEVPPVEFEQLASKTPGESSASIRQRVNQARAVQQERFAGTSLLCNSQIPAHLLKALCPLTGDAQKLLKNAFDLMGLSARAYDRLLKVSRTIADLAGEEVIGSAHVARLSSTAASTGNIGRHDRPSSGGPVPGNRKAPESSRSPGSYPCHDISVTSLEGRTLWPGYPAAFSNAPS